MSLVTRFRATADLILKDILSGKITDEELSMARSMAHGHDEPPRIFHSSAEIVEIARGLDLRVAEEQAKRRLRRDTRLAEALERASDSGPSLVDLLDQIKNCGVSIGSGPNVARGLDREIAKLREEARVARLGWMARLWHRWTSRELRA